MFNYGKAKVREEGREWWGGGDNCGMSEKSEKRLCFCWDKFNKN